MSYYDNFVKENPHIASLDFEFVRMYKGTLTYVSESEDKIYTVEVTPEYRSELLAVETLASLNHEDEEAVETLLIREKAL